MLIYITGTLVSVFFATLSQLSRHKDPTTGSYSDPDPLWAFISLFPLFLISAFRYDVGTDYLRVYLPGYYRILYDIPTRFEPGYKLLNQIAVSLTGRPQTIFVLTSFLFCLFAFKSIYRLSVSPPYSILLLLLTNTYFVSMNMVRQSISIVLFYYSLSFRKKNRFFSFLIVILFAATMHLSALMMIPVWILCTVRIKPFFRIVILGTLLLFLNSFQEIFTFILLHSPYKSYLLDLPDNSSFGPWFFSVNLAVFLFICFLPKKNPRKNVPKESNMNLTIFSNLQLSAVFFAATSGTFPLAVRIVGYFSFSQVLFLPEAISQIRDPILRKCAGLVILVLYAVYMWVTTVLRGGQEVLPYQTIF